MTLSVESRGNSYDWWVASYKLRVSSLKKEVGANSEKL